MRAGADLAGIEDDTGRDHRPVFGEKLDHPTLDGFGGIAGSHRIQIGSGRGGGRRGVGHFCGIGGGDLDAI